MEITAKEFRDRFKKEYGRDIKYTEIKAHLGLDGRVGKDYKIDDSDIVTLAKAMGLKASEPPPPIKPASSRSNARKVRGRKDSRRAPTDIRVLPGDRKILQEVQDWVDAQHDKLPKDFRPSKVRNVSGGMVA